LKSIVLKWSQSGEALTSAPSVQTRQIYELYDERQSVPKSTSNVTTCGQLQKQSVISFHNTCLNVKVSVFKVTVLLSVGLAPAGPDHPEMCVEWIFYDFWKAFSRMKFQVC